jgi:hypothetical protein
MKAATSIQAVAVAILFAAVCRAEVTAVTDLDKAIAQASKQGKLLFVQGGRPACGNCQALRGYVAAGQVALPTNLYVYADVNIDDRKTAKTFMGRFKVEGNMLPFVVVADSDGRQLAARAGFGQPADFQELLKTAIKKATKSSALKKVQAAEKAAEKAVPVAQGAPAAAGAAR